MLAGDATVLIKKVSRVWRRGGSVFSAGNKQPLTNIDCFIKLYPKQAYCGKKRTNTWRKHYPKRYSNYALTQKPSRTCSAVICYRACMDG